MLMLGMHQLWRSRDKRKGRYWGVNNRRETLDDQDWPQGENEAHHKKEGRLNLSVARLKYTNLPKSFHHLR